MFGPERYFPTHRPKAVDVSPPREARTKFQGLFFALMKDEDAQMAIDFFDDMLKNSSIGKKVRQVNNPDLIMLYRAKSWRIEVKQVGFVRVDDKKAYRKDGWSEDLDGGYSALFKTEREAINWLFEHEKREIEMAEKKIKSAKSRLKKLNERYNKLA